MPKLINRNRAANGRRRGKQPRALSRAQRAARALRALERATTACPYCGSFESALLERGKPRVTHDQDTGASNLTWSERRQCVRCRNQYTIQNADA